MADRTICLCDYAGSAYQAIMEAGDFADLTVMLRAKGEGTERRAVESVRCHRLALAAWSPAMKRLIDKAARDGHPSWVAVGCDDLRPLRALLRTFYSAQVALSQDSVWAIRKVAKDLEVDVVVQQCDTYLEDHLNERTCVPWLAEAEAHNNPEFLEQCLATIAGSFDTVRSTCAFLNLDPSIVLRLLDCEAMAVNPPYALLKAAVEWIDFDHEGRVALFPEILSKIPLTDLSDDHREKLNNGNHSFTGMSEKQRAELRELIAKDREKGSASPPGTLGRESPVQGPDSPPASSGSGTFVTGGGVWTPPKLGTRGARSLSREVGTHSEPRSVSKLIAGSMSKSGPVPRSVSGLKTAPAPISGSDPKSRPIPRSGSGTNSEPGVVSGPAGHGNGMMPKNPLGLSLQSLEGIFLADNEIISPGVISPPRLQLPEGSMKRPASEGAGASSIDGWMGKLGDFEELGSKLTSIIEAKPIDRLASLRVASKGAPRERLKPKGHRAAGQDNAWQPRTSSSKGRPLRTATGSPALYLPLTLVGNKFPKWSPEVEVQLRTGEHFRRLVFVCHRWETSHAPDVSRNDGVRVKKMLSKGVVEEEVRQISSYVLSPCIHDGFSFITVDGKAERRVGVGVEDLDSDGFGVGVFYDWSCLPQWPVEAKEQQIMRERQEWMGEYAKEVDSIVVLDSEGHNGRTWCVFEMASCLIGLRTFQVSPGWLFPHELRLLHGLIISVSYCMDKLLEGAYAFYNDNGKLSFECRGHNTFKECQDCPLCHSMLTVVVVAKFGKFEIGFGCLWEVLAATVLILFRNTAATEGGDVQRILRQFHNGLITSLKDPLGMLRRSTDVDVDHGIEEAVFFMTSQRKFGKMDTPAIKREVVEFTKRYKTGYRLIKTPSAPRRNSS